MKLLRVRVVRFETGFTEIDLVLVVGITLGAGDVGESCEVPFLQTH